MNGSLLAVAPFAAGTPAATVPSYFVLSASGASGRSTRVRSSGQENAPAMAGVKLTDRSAAARSTGWLKRIVIAPFAAAWFRSGPGIRPHTGPGRPSGQGGATGAWFVFSPGMTSATAGETVVNVHVSAPLRAAPSTLVRSGATVTVYRADGAHPSAGWKRYIAEVSQRPVPATGGSIWTTGRLGVCARVRR